MLICYINRWLQFFNSKKSSLIKLLCYRIVSLNKYLINIVTFENNSIKNKINSYLKHFNFKWSPIINTSLYLLSVLSSSTTPTSSESLLLFDSLSRDLDLLTFNSFSFKLSCAPLTTISGNSPVGRRSRSDENLWKDNGGSSTEGLFQDVEKTWWMSLKRGNPVIK